MRLGPVASVLGIAAGAWIAACATFLKSYAFPFTQEQCLNFGPCHAVTVAFTALATGLGLALVVVSAAANFGPRAVMYAEAGVSALVVVLLVLGEPAMSAGYFALGIVLAIAALAVGLFSVLRVSGLSEQANPMNLPVFG